MGAPVNQPQNNNTTSNVGGSNLADFLFKQGKIDAEQLKKIKFEAINSGKSIEDIVLSQGLADVEEVTKLKAESYGIPYVDLLNQNLTTDLLQRIPQEVAAQNKSVAFAESDQSISVAMADPLDLQKVKFLQTLLGKNIRPFFASLSAINSIIDTRYGAQVGQEVEEALEEVEGVVDIKTTAGSTEDITSNLESAPVSKIVNMILEYAAKFKSSDIHIEPRENKLSVRYRVNGVMSEKLSLPKKLIPPIVSRIKILANLKIDEHRIPQDGRIQIKVDNNNLIDLRVSIVPTVYGEKVVMRLLERGSSVLALEKTGLRGSAYKIYLEALAKTQGIILITGPTGSGKTQTLASSLSILNKPDVNIMTLENPVEIRIDGVNQVQVNPDVGLTFAKGLRAFLRQDPDIIMVGEIRDAETAELAIQASLTGHLVLATLHTNSAAGALPRLIDMGIQPYLLASTINVVVAQRLVRTLSDKSKQPYEAPATVINQLQKSLGTINGFDMYKVFGDPGKVELFKATDADPQNPSGYSGRIGIFEAMRMTETLSQMVISKKTSAEIERQARQEGMITMVQDGFMKALEGVTTLEEVLRVQN